MIPTPMIESTVTGWQERPHLDGDLIRFRFNGKLYMVTPDLAANLSDDELAARFARPLDDVAHDLIGGA